VSDNFDPDRAVATVTAFNAAFMARDIQRMRSFWTEDFVQWHSHIRKDFTLEEEVALLEAVLDSVFIEFYDVRMTPTSDGVLMQHRGNVRLASGAEARDVPFAAVYHFRGDEICRCEEYVDGMSLPPMDMLPNARRAAAPAR
jgi:ketosteroid isomerase-like protein